MLLGIDIGGTKCAVVAGSADGHVLQKVRFETRAERGPEAVLEDLKEAAAQVLHQNGRNAFQAAGISCGGPLDSRTGRVLGPPNLPGWDDVPVVDIFQEWLGIRVALQNDANACALAEWKYGAGQGCRNMVFLTFGTGMGAGLILDGRLYSGTNDLAGEVGHLRLAERGPIGFGKAGSFEGFCSGGGIARLAAHEIRKARESGRMSLLYGPSPLTHHEVTAKDVFDACEAGDGLARDIVETVGKRLGQGLALIVDILNPERIVIGSIFARSGHLLIPAMQAELEREAIPSALAVCEVVPAGLGDSIGDVAALAVAAVALASE